MGRHGSRRCAVACRIGSKWPLRSLVPMTKHIVCIGENRMWTSQNCLSHTKLAMSAAIFVLFQPCGAALSQPASTQPPLIHDGSHDFDFLIGDWKAHLRRLVDRETGVTTSDPRTGAWVDYDGICNDRKLLDTNANLEQFEVQASGTHQSFRGQALRMYNPASHQWSIYGLD